MSDLCRAILLALEGNVSGEVFQIATGVETSIMELAEMVRGVAGRDVSVRYGPPRQGDMRQNYFRHRQGAGKVELGATGGIEPGVT